jgi:hypothetical protein
MKTYESNTYIEMDFCDLFKFAEVEYGIDWNSANDVFFGNCLEYGKLQRIYPEEWKDYVYTLDEILGKKSSEATDREIRRAMDNFKALNIPKEEVEEMDNNDQSYVILGAFFETINITKPVLMDCS